MIKQLKSDKPLSLIYLTEVSKKDVLAGLDYVSKNPPPPTNSKGMGVIIDINTPNEPIMDVFDDLSVPNNAKFLRKNVWVVHENEQNAFIPSDDYFIVFFIDPNDMKKIEHVGIGTDRGDNKLIDEVLDLLNAKFGANF